MLALKLIVFSLVISTSVLGRDTRKENVRHRQPDDEYKYNHPPTPENYEPIPVAVVYENDSGRGEKSLKTNVTLDSSNITDEVSKDPLQFESTTIKKYPKDIIDSNNNDEIEIKKPTDVEENETKVTTYRPQSEFQIPVAVVYEPESTYYQKRRPNANRTTNKRRRTQKPVSVDKHTDKDGNIGSDEHRVTQVNGHTGPDVVSSSNKRRKNTTPVPENKKIKSNPPSSLISVEIAKSNKTQTQNVEEVKNSSVDKISSNPRVNKKEELNTKEDIKPTKLEMKIIEVNRKPPRSQEREKSTAISQVHIDTEGDQQLRKRDNSTRVREVIPIVQSENVVYSHSGNFKYSYEGGDGTKAFEAGELKTFDDESAGEAVSGGFSYKAKDGNEYSLSYTADENGYRPVGAHLPTPPPIPPAIARALAYLATKTTPAPVTESIAEYDQ